MAARLRARSGIKALMIVGWLGLVLVFGLFAVVLCARIPLNHDLAAHLDTIHRMLIGDRLYADILEPNPPLVFYL